MVKYFLSLFRVFVCLFFQEKFTRFVTCLNNLSILQFVYDMPLKTGRDSRTVYFWKNMSVCIHCVSNQIPYKSMRIGLLKVCSHRSIAKAKLEPLIKLCYDLA